MLYALLAAASHVLVICLACKMCLCSCLSAKNVLEAKQSYP